MVIGLLSYGFVLIHVSLIQSRNHPMWNFLENMDLCMSYLLILIACVCGGVYWVDIETYMIRFGILFK